MSFSLLFFMYTAVAAVSNSRRTGLSLLSRFAYMVTLFDFKWKRRMGKPRMKIACQNAHTWVERSTVLHHTCERVSVICVFAHTFTRASTQHYWAMCALLTVIVWRTYSHKACHYFPLLICDVAGIRTTIDHKRTKG